MNFVDETEKLNSVSGHADRGDSTLIVSSPHATPRPDFPDSENRYEVARESPGQSSPSPRNGSISLSQDPSLLEEHSYDQRTSNNAIRIEYLLSDIDSPSLSLPPWYSTSSELSPQTTLYVDPGETNILNREWSEHLHYFKSSIGWLWVREGKN